METEQGRKAKDRVPGAEWAVVEREADAIEVTFLFSVVLISKNCDDVPKRFPGHAMILPEPDGLNVGQNGHDERKGRKRHSRISRTI
jgi:hypothetical protein